MRKSTRILLLGISAGIAATAAAAYGLIVRPWHLRWGATREELTAPMPFDQLIRKANYFATRAITIDATPDEVWPFVIDESALSPGTVIRHLEEKRCVVFAPPEIEAEATWVVTLEARGTGTRLVSRNRARFARRLSAVLRYLMVDPGQFVIERDWMLSIQAHAEELSRTLRVASVELREPPRESELPSQPATRNSHLQDEVQVPELVP